MLIGRKCETCVPSKEPQKHLSFPTKTGVSSWGMIGVSGSGVTSGLEPFCNCSAWLL